MNVKAKCCCCLYNNLEEKDITYCKSGHVTCLECIQRAMKVAVGDNKQFHCFSEDGCTHEFTHTDLVRAVKEKNLRKAYDVVVAHHSISNVVHDLYICPFCNEGFIVQEDLDSSPIFSCRCEKTSCRRCEQSAHEGTCPTQVAALLHIKCFCGTTFIRGDNCNKLTCPKCQTAWCWWCKDAISKVGYEHFHRGTCNLWGKPKRELYSLEEDFEYRPPNLWTMLSKKYLKELVKKQQVSVALKIVSDERHVILNTIDENTQDETLRFALKVDLRDQYNAIRFWIMDINDYYKQKTSTKVKAYVNKKVNSLVSLIF